MDSETYIAIEHLCSHYQLEPVFFESIQEFGLIEYQVVNQQKVISVELVKDLETIMHLHCELEINLQGVEAILHLLQKVNHLQSELETAKIRLSQLE